MSGRFGMFLGTPASMSVYVAVIATGAALGLLVALLRCRARDGQCPVGSGITLGERIKTLFWTVTGGVVTTLTGHWIVRTGLADDAIVWLTALRKLFG